MNQQEIVSWEFNELKGHLRSENEIGIYFSFKDQEQRYIMVLRKRNDLWEVRTIEHNLFYMIATKKHDKTCSFCRSFTGMCLALNDKKEKVYESIKNHPKLRLKLLFMQEKNL